jgi:hypothetical protein
MWEPVVEVTQIKGDSEAHPMFSPMDEYADFETYQFVLTEDGGTPDPTEGDYVRSGLKRRQHDSRPELRTHMTGLGTSRGWDMGASGLVGVWAPKNTRRDLVDAFKRKDGSEQVGNTVDLATGKYTTTIGEEQLSAYWQDPDFDPTRHAFCHVRVSQIPTPRYSLLDAIALGADPKETNRPATIRERAYSP